MIPCPPGEITSGTASRSETLIKFLNQITFQTCERYCNEMIVVSFAFSRNGPQTARNISLNITNNLSLLLL